MKVIESKEESPISRLFREIPATNYKRREKVIPIDNEAVLRDFTYYTGGMFILTNIKIEDRKDYDGIAEFSSGIAIASLGRLISDNHELTEAVIKHELAHMLGLKFHHLENEKCLMTEGINSYRLCRNCHNAINSFWNGIEERTNEKYLKV